MADNVAITSGVGTTIAADDIGAGVLAQRVKPVWGPDGTGNDVDVATGKPFPIQVRSATGLIPVGEPTDAKAAQTDTTSVSIVSILKQLSAYLALLVFGAGTAAASQRVNIATDQAWPTGMSPRAFAVAFATLTRPANTTAYAAGDSVSDNATAGSVTALVSGNISDTNDDPLTITELHIASTDTGLAGKNIRAHIFNSDPTASSGVVGGDNAAYSQKKAGYVGTFIGALETGFSDGSVGRLTPVGQFIVTKPSSGAKTLWIQFQAIDAFTPSANSTTIIATARGYQARAA